MQNTSTKYQLQSILQIKETFPWVPPQLRKMALTLNIEKVFVQESERVKSVDVHPTEPWVLSSLHSGTVHIWNHQTQSMLKSINVSQGPVRSAKFIAHKKWIVTGSDDGYIRVYNYETMENMIEIEAHKDFIRSLAVHPRLPLLVSASDDMTVKAWDWDKEWSCSHVFEGHKHYVMQVAFNPNDPNILASVSLDGTIKIWNLEFPSAPEDTLGQVEFKGLNCVDYYWGNNSNDERPLLVAGSDDHTAKIWDCKGKSLVGAVEGHSNNVCAVRVHPELPIIITASEDATACIWHATNYRLEKTLNHELGRVWAVGCVKGSNLVAFGCDNGLVMLKIDGL